MNFGSDGDELPRMRFRAESVMAPLFSGRCTIALNCPKEKIYTIESILKEWREGGRGRRRGGGNGVVEEWRAYSTGTAPNPPGMTHRPGTLIDPHRCQSSGIDAMHLQFQSLNSFFFQKKFSNYLNVISLPLPPISPHLKRTDRLNQLNF